MSEDIATCGENVPERRICSVRGRKVILDSALARIYGVPTKALNQAVKRNRDKFPTDLIFQLTEKEADAIHPSRSQSVTLKRGQIIKYLPHAFTEHGANRLRRCGYGGQVMAATVLNSPRAVLTYNRELARKQIGFSARECRSGYAVMRQSLPRGAR